MPALPLLRTATRPLLRTDHRGERVVQIGVHPDAGVLLPGLSAAELEFLSSLDGTRDRAGLQRLARRIGLTGARADALLGVLTAHEVLLERRPAVRPATPHGRPAPARWRAAVTAATEAPASPAANGILVDGDGTVPEAVAALLREAGHAVRGPGPHAAATHDLELRERPSAPAADFVVLVAGPALAPYAGEPWRARGIGHLPVLVTDHRVSVGPIVDGGGPCLRCLDLHRTDRDPDWPRVLAQLCGPFGAPLVDLDAAGAALAAGLAAGLVNGYFDAGTPPRGISWELTLGLPELVPRRWRRHPLCGCGAAPGGGEHAA